MIFEHMDRIVFAGDSVTDMESAQPVGEGLFDNVGKSYVRIVKGRKRRMIFEHMDRIVFAGDSVTDMESAQPVGEGLFDNVGKSYVRIVDVTDMESAQPVGEGLFDNVGKSYVRIVENMLAAWYPERYVRVTNSGISGNTSRDLLARFERDVVSLKPDWVSICIGINDVWRQFDSPAIPDEQVMPEEYEANLEKMICSVKDSVKGIFILTPYYMEPNREDWMRKRMDEYGAVEEYEANLEKMICSVKDSVKGIFILTPYYMEPNREDWMRKRMDEYGAVCRKLSEKYGCRLVDLQQVFDEYFQYRHSSYIAWDRVHPNLIGATVIASRYSMSIFNIVILPILHGTECIRI